jgi:Asp-tRNA(Asn)/Glu-tRNA(Gln) amidotransferase C subunit
MLINITDNPSILQNQDGSCLVQEFVFGARFNIIVETLNNKIYLTQDEKYNAKIIGHVLELEEFWETIKTNYRINEERFFRTPLVNYKIECIFYDSDNMIQKSMPYRYNGKGIIVNNIHHEDGVVVHSKIESLCNDLMLPYNSPLFVGDFTVLQGTFQSIRNRSKLTNDQLGGGIVIRNEPCEKIGNSIVEWVVYSDNSSFIEEKEEAEHLADEFVKIVYTIENIYEIEDNTKISPATSPTKFRNILLKDLKLNHEHEYNDYLNRSTLFADNDKIKKFDNLLKNSMKNYFKETVLKSKRYELLNKDSE